MKAILDIERLCRDQRIPHSTEGNKHCRAGWVQICCPFCNDSDFHLGYNLTSGYFNCYKCGGLSAWKVMERLLGKSGNRLTSLLEKYALTGARPTIRNMEVRHNADELRLPPGTGPLNKAARSYLESRGYDPDTLIDQYGLQSTGFSGAYAYRVIIPVMFQGQLVSYLGRDYTGKQESRYKACEMADEVMHHKHTLYGYDQAVVNDWVIIVEGVTSVWRFGVGAVATYGVEFSATQLMLLRGFRNRLILFDNDDAGSNAAERLGVRLGSFPGRTMICELPSDYEDPASVPQHEVTELKSDLLDAFT